MPQVVIVSSLGPQGQVGPQGPVGPMPETGSLVTTASFNAFTASYTTGSFTGSFTGSATLGSLTASSALVTGNVTVLGTASINTLIVNQTQLSTGSNQLGDAADDTQTLYGSVIVPTGSLTVTGSTIVRDLTLLSTSTSFTSSNDVYNWYLTGKSFSVASQEASPNGVYFKPDGTKMYITGPTTDRVYAYDLSIPWDITTCIYSGENILVNSQDTAPIDLYFRSDGLKMYMLGSTNDRVYEYTLSVAWSLTSASFLQFFSVSSQETGPGGIYFKPDGTKMYIVGTTSDTVFAYDLGTPWDISTSVYNGENLNIAVQEAGASGISFSNDGSKLYVIGTSGDDITQFNLTIPWNVSTGVFSYESINFDFFLSETTPSGLYYNETVNKAYIIGSGIDTVFELNTNPNLLIQASSSHLSGDLSVARYTSLNNSVSVKGTVDVTSTITTLANFIGTGTVRTAGGMFAGSTSFSPNAMMQIRGSGSSAGSAALRVENTNQSSSLVILDDNTSIFNTNTLYVSGSGLVGIGTSTPFSSLHIQKTTGSLEPLLLLDVNSLTTGSGAILRFNTSPGDKSIGSDIVGIRSGTAASSSLYFSTYPGSGTTNVERMRITSDGNIGIGTSTPSAKLDVSGSIALNGNIIQNQTNLDLKLSGLLDGRALRFIASSAGARIQALGSTASNLSLGTTVGGSEVTRLTILEGGNVGIGTTTPTAKLQVVGSGTTSATTALLVQNANASSSLAVLDNGNVGIGTSTPTAKLEIKATGSSETTQRWLDDEGKLLGDFAEVGDAGILRIGYVISSISTNRPLITLDGGAGNSSAGIYLRSKSATNNIRIASDIPSYISGSSLALGFINPAASAILHISGAAADNLFRVDTPAVPYTLFVTGSGNVGIGTSTPTERLEVNGSILIEGSSDYRLKLGAPIGQQFSLGTVWNGSYDTMFIDYSALGSPRIMTFQGNGNVGIGTTTPSAKLHVSGTIKIESTAAEKHLEFTRVGNNYISTANGGALLINVVGTAAENTSLFRVYPSAVMVGSGIPLTTATFNVRGSGTTSGTTALLVQNANASASLVVLDNGNVGIGTTDPTSKLDVAGDAIFQTNTYIRVSGTTNSGLNLMNTNTGSIFAKFGYVGGGANDSFIGSLTNNNFSIRSANIDRITVLNTGNVGIGTITPSASLHISGASSANLLRIDSPASSSILFVSGSGNVGIGTVTPSALLQVGAVIGTGTNVYSFTGYKFGVENGTSRFIGPEVTSSNQSTTIVDFVLGASAAHQNPTGLLTFTGRDRGNNFNSGILGYIGIAKSTAANSSGSGNLVFGTAADSSLTSTERMRITSTGNIGIGTTTPSASLHISGSSGSVLLEIDSNSQQNILYVSGSGNVGIGTSTPTQKLDVDGAVLVRAGNAVYFRDTVSYIGEGLGLNIVSGATRNIRLNAGGSDRMFVSASGNVGIGTSTPTSTLDIQSTTTGSIRISGSAGSQITLVRPTAGLTGYVRYLGTSMEIGTAGSDGLTLNTLNTARLSVQTNGDIGIGLSAGAPSARLQVRGLGTTSATSTFRLENSSALPSLVVTDDLNSRFFGNVGIGAAAASGSLHVSASASTSSAAVYIYKSGSTTLDIQGSQGQLFSVTDQLSGSLMSVNDISGLPILEVFSDDRVVMGSFASPALVVTGSAVRFPATASAAPTYSGSNGETIFTVIGGNAFMYVWLGGRWRSGSLA